MDKELEAIKKALASMKKIETEGFTDPQKAKAYFEEKEMLLEGIVKTLESVSTEQAKEVEALKTTVKSLREEIKERAAYPKELTEKELCYKLGRGLAAAVRGNQQVLGELGFTPNLGNENWTNPRALVWEMGKGWVQKAALGDPMGDMSTSDQFLIHPIYENELVAIAEKKSVMMNLVETSTMTGPNRIIPVEEEVNVALEWLTTYGEEITETAQPKTENVELKALTCAGYIRFYDEFEEDAFIDLGKLFIKKFTGAYAKEFDRQCLTANSNPFTGALASGRGKSVQIAGAGINALTWEDFDKAVMQVPEEERRNCRWFLHETVAYHVRNLKDQNGNPVMQKSDRFPGVINSYPFHECHVMPQLSGIGANTPFAVFMDPARIHHGNRKGIELKRFEGTSESLKFGTKALRFRKRDGFAVVAPKNHYVIMKTKP